MKERVHGSTVKVFIIKSQVHHGLAWAEVKSYGYNSAYKLIKCIFTSVLVLRHDTIKYYNNYN